MGNDAKVALVTGSTDGVGRYVAAALGAAGVHVLIHGRNRERGEALVAEIRGAGGEATFYAADFASLSDVRTLAEAVLQNHSRLDLLINNAGIGTGGRNAVREISADGYELRFAVNYLSGFLLTYLLLARLRAARTARIVNVSSLGQQPIDFDDVMITRGYSGTRAYSQSKLAQIAFTFDLASELEGSNVTANCLHPATYMNTTMVRLAGVGPISAVEEGGEAILRLAVAPEMEGRSGGFYDGLQAAKAHPTAYDAALRERLSVLSLSLAATEFAAGFAFVETA